MGGFDRDALLLERESLRKPVSAPVRMFFLDWSESASAGTVKGASDFVDSWFAGKFADFHAHKRSQYWNIGLSISGTRLFWRCVCSRNKH
jgi:hypothetical protein